MKSDSQLVWAIVIFIVAFLLGTISGVTEISPVSETLIVVAATVAAAFVGAWSAYALQWRRLAIEGEKEQVRALNELQLSIIVQIRLLEQITREYLDPVRANSRRALLMRSSIDYEYNRTQTEISKVSFLLDTAHRNIMLRLSLTEENFRTAVEVFNTRSQLMRSDVFPRIEANDNFDFVNHSHEELVVMLGSRTSAMLRSYTDHSYELIDASLPELCTLSKDIFDICIDLYPQHEFVAYIRNDETTENGVNS